MKIFKNVLIATLLALSLLVGMTACTKPQGDADQAIETKESEAQAQDNGKTVGEKTRIRVVLDWYPNAIHSFLYMAEEKGYFAEAGLEVELLMPSNPTDPITLAATDQADIGLYYLQDVVQTVATQDIPLKSIGAIVHQPLSIVMSLKDKNIKEPKDLVGKTVGYSSNVLSEAIVRTMLAKNSVDPSSVKFIDVGWDLMTSLTSGNCDATLGALVNHEVPVMEEQGFALNYFFPYEYGLPKYYELSMITSENTLTTKGAALKAFLAAATKGFKDVQADPEAAVHLLLEKQNKENFPLTESVEKKSLAILLPLMESDNEPFLSQDKKVWTENIVWELENQIISKKISADDIVVDLVK